MVIATALVLNPDLLILDEPTSALDVSVQAQIMNLLKDLKEDPGISMIFITHDIGLASDLCDQIAVAYAGQHVEFGPAERVLVEPRHPYTQLLLASLPRLHERRRPRPLPGEPPDLHQPAGRLPLPSALPLSLRAVRTDHPPADPARRRRPRPLLAERSGGRRRALPDPPASGEAAGSVG